jgi:hypothetical protein
MTQKTPPVSRIVSLVAKLLKAALNGSFARRLRTRPSHQEIEAFDAAENQTFGQQTGSVDESSLGRDQQKRPSRGPCSSRRRDLNSGPLVPQTAQRSGGGSGQVARGGLATRDPQRACAECGRSPRAGERLAHPVRGQGRSGDRDLLPGVRRAGIRRTGLGGTPRDPRLHHRRVDTPRQPAVATHRSPISRPWIGSAPTLTLHNEQLRRL